MEGAGACHEAARIAIGPGTSGSKNATRASFVRTAERQDWARWHPCRWRAPCFVCVIDDIGSLE
jgi:hypothetical protein